MVWSAAMRPLAYARAREPQAFPISADASWDQPSTRARSRHRSTHRGDGGRGRTLQGRPVRSSAFDRHAFVGAPRSDVGGAGLIDLPDLDVRVLPVGRREGSAHYFPLASLVGETVADAKIHRQDLGDGRLVLLLSATRPRHGLVEQPSPPDLAPHREGLPKLDAN